MTATVHLHVAAHMRLEDQRHSGSPQAPRSCGPCTSAPLGGRLLCQAPVLTGQGRSQARVLGRASGPRLLASRPTAAQARATDSHLFTLLHVVQQPPLLFASPISCYLYKYRKNLEFGESGSSSVPPSADLQLKTAFQIIPST